MSRRKAKEESVGVHMRLPVSVVARLDELARRASGSRGDVVKLLVAQAQVEHVQRSVVTVTLPEVSERLATDES